MSMIRACSYQATIQLPDAAANYSAILVTVSQEDVQINKSKPELILNDNQVTIMLDQTETKQFVACKSAYLQIRCYKSQYEAPGSKIWSIAVFPSLNEEVLPLS